jgi:hypothetical protein
MLRIIVVSDAAGETAARIELVLDSKGGSFRL